MTSIGNTPASYITTLLQTTGPVFHGRVGGIGPEDTDEAAAAILKIVNTISVETTAASKAAAAKIGDAALRAAEIWASPNHGSSQGVRYYDRPEDIEDPEYRAIMVDFARKEAAQKAIDAVTPAIIAGRNKCEKEKKYFPSWKTILNQIFPTRLAEPAGEMSLNKAICHI